MGRPPPFAFTAAELDHLVAVARSLRARGVVSRLDDSTGVAADLAVRLVGVVAAEHGPDIARAVLNGCLDALDRWAQKDPDA